MRRQNWNRFTFEINYKTNPKPVLLLLAITSIIFLTQKSVAADKNKILKTNTVAFRDVTGSVLIASADGITQLSLDGLNTTHQLQNGPNIGSIDYDFKTKTLFWFSEPDKIVYSGSMSRQNVKSVVSNASNSIIRGLSYDWITDKMYWTDIYQEEIGVLSKNGKLKKVLFDRIDAPASIVVNPLSGWMYWADIHKSRIERAAMDGSKREAILSTDITSPYGLTIDFEKNRIYWTQNEPSSISSSNLDGSDRKLILAATQQGFLDPWFTSITTFEDSIYWIESRSNTIYQANKIDGGNLALIYKSDSKLFDIKIYDVSRQPRGENVCARRIKKCSHFCFLVPSTGKNDPVLTSCGCPDELNLSIDGRTCIRK